MGKFRIIILLALGICFATCSVKTVPSRPTPSLSEAGYEGPAEATFYYVEGLKKTHIGNDPVRAARFFDKAIEADPGNSAAYYAAATNVALLDPELALDYSRKANELDSTNVWYKGQLGRLMILNGQYKEALQTYQQLIRISPNDPDNYRMLAALYEITNLPFVAISLLDSAEYKFGRLEELAAFKRELLIKVKLYDKAIAESRELVDLFPYKYENYLILGDLYALTGKDSLAMDNYRQALELNPDGVDVLGSMNEYYKNKGDDANYFATAKKLFQNDEVPLEMKVKFLRDITQSRDYYVEQFFRISDLASTLVLKHPYSYEAVDLYATNMIMYGNIEEGLKVYKAFVTDTTTNMEVFNNILDIEGYLGRTDSLEKYTTLALERLPDNPDLYMRQGYAYVYMEKEDRAVASFEKALKYAENDSVRSVILGSIGDVYHQKGDNKTTYNYYKKALKLYPDNAVVLNNYAYFLSLEKKELDLALEMSARVMELVPGNSTYLDTYGWVLYELGRYDEAKKIIQQAISLDRSGSKELLFHYGEILYALGDDFMASVYWKKAKEAGYDPDIVEQRLTKTGGK